MTTARAKKAATHKAELLRDRQDYRTALIQRREDIERKISRVEQQIKTLRDAGKEVAA